jgi:hypothetical protein
MEDGVMRHYGVGSQKIAEVTTVVTIKGQQGAPLHRKVVAGQPIPPDLLDAYGAARGSVVELVSTDAPVVDETPAKRKPTAG